MAVNVARSCVANTFILVSVPDAAADRLITSPSVYSWIQNSDYCLIQLGYSMVHMRMAWIFTRSMHMEGSKIGHVELTELNSAAV